MTDRPPRPRPPTAPATTPAPWPARSSTPCRRSRRRRATDLPAGRRPPTTCCGTRSSPAAATRRPSLPRGARLRLDRRRRRRLRRAAAAPARPPRRAAQRGRHREGAVAGLPRRRASCCSPTWAGCWPPIVEDTSGRHDAFCGTTHAAPPTRRATATARPTAPRPTGATTSPWRWPSTGSAGATSRRTSTSSRASASSADGSLALRRRPPGPARTSMLRAELPRARHASSTCRTRSTPGPTYTVTAAAGHGVAGRRRPAPDDPARTATPEARAGLPQHRAGRRRR